MTRRALAGLWTANVGVIVALSCLGRRLQRIVAGATSPETRVLIAGVVLFVALAAALAALGAERGRRAVIRASALVPLLALGLWLVPLPEEQLHFLVFGTFGALTFSLFPPGRAASVALTAAVADELLQGALPDRFFDVRDIAMNSASALAGGWAIRETR